MCMKKRFCAAFCLGLLLNLWGCAAEPLPTASAFTEAPEPVAAESRILMDWGGLEETWLLSDVPGQDSAVLLSVRSDGTVDYLVPENATGSNAWLGLSYRHYTISPDGTVMLQPTDWAYQLETALGEASAAVEGKTKRELFFYAREGELLMHARMRFLSEDREDYQVLFRLRDGGLTQIPLRWDAVKGDVERIDPLDDGLLIATDRGLYAFDYDGTEKTIACDDPEATEFLGAAGSVGWFRNVNRTRIVAYDLWDGTLLTEQSRRGESIRTFAISPDGSMLYLHSMSFITGQISLECIGSDGVGLLTQNPYRYYMGDRTTPVQRMAVTNDGVLYTIHGTEDGVMLLRYRDHIGEESP